MDRVGIVLVSHSEKVVTGIQEILHEVLDDFPLAIAGGSDDGGIGTSVEKIERGIDAVYSEKGVLIFYDLGSAKMNAEIAIEMSDKDHVTIVEGPILEGAYIGAVESNMGKTMTEIVKSIHLSFPEVNY